MLTPTPRRRSTWLAAPAAGLTLTLALTLTMSLAVAGCGFSAESALEDLAEEATGLAIDHEDGEISVATDRLEVRFDTEGDTTEGSAGSTAGDDAPAAGLQVDLPVDAAASRAEVPQGFEVPHPPGGVVQAGSAASGGGGNVMDLAVGYGPGEVDRLIRFYEDYFGDRPGVARHDVDTADGPVYGFYDNADGRLVAVTIHERPDGVLVFIETAGGSG